MKPSWRSVTVVPLLGLSLVLASCSGDQNGLITSPSNGLSREAPLTHVDHPVQSCEVTALDYFGDGAMPFTISCEDMDDAQVEVTGEEYNDAGCPVCIRGVVSFPGTTGHAYNFTATTGDCQHDGGSLKVCGTQLEGCVQVSLPRLQIVQPGHQRTRMN